MTRPRISPMAHPVRQCSVAEMAVRFSVWSGSFTLSEGYVSLFMDHDHAFGSSTPFSLGVEEELFLVDVETGAQIDASHAVLERIGPVDGTVERELHACQVELITGVCATAAEAAGTLGGLRRAVAATGAGLLGSGIHPAAPEGAAQITDKERYERIRELLGDAV